MKTRSMVRTVSAAVVATAMIVGLAACNGGTGDESEAADVTETEGPAPSGGAAGIQDIPSYDDVDDNQLAEPATDEHWRLDMASGSSMTVAEFDGEQVLLSGTRRGDVEVFGLADGEMRQSHSVHDGAIRDVHAVEVASEPTVVTVEVGLAKVWSPATGDVAYEIDLGSNYDFTAVVEYQGKPVFVNGSKEIVMTDLETGETVQHYKYDLGLSPSSGNVVELDGNTVLVADNVIGGEYSVGAWNLDDGSTIYDYPMYEHENRAINQMASGYLGDTVLTVTGDHGGEIVAWNVSNNSEYGPSISPDGSAVTALTVVELNGALIGIAGTLDRTLMMWNVKSGGELEVFESPATGITQLIVAEMDGRPMVMAGGDGWAMPYWLG